MFLGSRNMPPQQSVPGSLGIDSINGALFFGQNWYKTMEIITSQRSTANTETIYKLLDILQNQSQLIETGCSGGIGYFHRARSVVDNHDSRLELSRSCFDWSCHLSNKLSLYFEHFTKIKRNCCSEWKRGKTQRSELCRKTDNTETFFISASGNAHSCDFPKENMEERAAD